MVWISDWATTTGIDPNVIGVTRVRYNAMNGEMTDVDIALNVKSTTNPVGFEFNVVVGENVSGKVEDQYRDLEKVLTHQAGHFSGLGDIYNPGYAPYVPSMGESNQEYTMYGMVLGDETIKRTITGNDKAGIEWIYNNAPRATSNSCVSSTEL